MSCPESQQKKAKGQRSSQSAFNCGPSAFYCWPSRPSTVKWRPSSPSANNADPNFTNIAGPTNRNKTIKDGDIAPWKDFKKEKRKRNQIRPYFEMGRIVKRLHFLCRPFPKNSPRFLQDFPKISKRFLRDFPKTFPRFPQDFYKISLRFL